MNKPIIEINGKKIELPPVKARVWREIIKFDEERKTILSADYVDKHCEIIALLFGVTKDEVLDNLEILEVIPLYSEILTYIVAMLSVGLGDGKKNTPNEAE